MPKSDAWQWMRERAAKSFERYMKPYNGYSSREKIVAEAAFYHGFRAGVLAGRKPQKLPGAQS